MTFFSALVWAALRFTNYGERIVVRNLRDSICANLDYARFAGLPADDLSFNRSGPVTPEAILETS